MSNALRSCLFYSSLLTFVISCSCLVLLAHKHHTFALCRPQFRAQSAGTEVSSSLAIYSPLTALVDLCLPGKYIEFRARARELRFVSARHRPRRPFLNPDYSSFLQYCV